MQIDIMWSGCAFKNELGKFSEGAGRELTIMVKHHLQMNLKQHKWSEG